MLVENKTWTITPLPSNRLEIKGHWVFTLKKGSNAKLADVKYHFIQKQTSVV